MNSSGNKEIVDRLNTILGAKKYVNIKLGSSLDGLIFETGVLNWSGTPNMFIMRNNGGEYTKPGKFVNQIVDADISFAHEFLGHAYQYVTGNLNHKRIDFIINGKRLGALKAVEADAVNIANTYALFTLRASMISHVYIENTFRSLHGKEISEDDFLKLSKKQANEVINPTLYHQIPVYFNLTNKDSQQPNNYRLNY